MHPLSQIIRGETVIHSLIDEKSLQMHLTEIIIIIAIFSHSNSRYN